MPETHHRICPICEAGCGLKIDVDRDAVIGISPNDADVFSEGHICAKGLSLQELHADPDRLRVPLIHEEAGFREASWEEAYALINNKLNRVIEEHGNQSVAIYFGNPTAHNIGLATAGGVLAGVIGSAQVYSAGSVDQLPKQLASELMFGNDMAIPVPDIANADYMLMLGANPVVSNGSLWMVPDIRGKFRAFRERGGQLVTVDPRRTETARVADEHLFIRPGTDAWFLAALINELRRAGCSLPTEYPVENANALFELLSSIDGSKASEVTGISEAQTRLIAEQLQAADCPVVNGRVGTTIQKHGTLTSFLIEVVNLLTGSLDKRGGAVFPEQPFHRPSTVYTEPAYARYHSRVSGYPEVTGQLPVAALAEEIETPGDGQVRALVCLAGNPVVSNPDSDRLEAALGKLDCMVCIDIYHTETSRLADVILPGSSPFEDSHYDQFLGSMGHRNTARYSPPVFASDRPDEWRALLTLSAIVAQKKVPNESELDQFEDGIVAQFVADHCSDEIGPLYEGDVQDIMSRIEPGRGVERMLDVGVRAGRFGDHFGQRDGLTLNKMSDAKDGIDLGPIRANRLKEVVRRPGGKLDLGPAIVLEDLKKLIVSEPEPGFMLIGRRNTRTNNSWLRNIPMLGKGKNLCVLEINEIDAAELGISSGDAVIVSTDTASLKVVAEPSPDIAQGVVSMPHGFSSEKALQQSHLQTGENYNRLVAAAETDGPSGSSALNGVAVTLESL